MGLIVIPGLVIYLIISVLLVMKVGRIAHGYGKSSVLFGGVVALVLYLIPFWDWVPTVAMHEYYCRREAGFWVYKTLDQWKAENPGIIETLLENKDRKIVQTKYGEAIVFKQRFMLLTKYEGPLHLNRWRLTSEVRDSLNGEILERRVDYSISQERRDGNSIGWKLWLNRDGCSDMSHVDMVSVGLISNLF